MSLPKIIRPKTSFELIGKRVRFLYVDEFTGGEGDRIGTAIDDARAFIEEFPQHAAEFGGVMPGEAIIVRTLIMQKLHIVRMWEILDVQEIEY